MLPLLLLAADFIVAVAVGLAVVATVVDAVAAAALVVTAVAT